MKPTNVLCLLLAVTGLSFGVGQSTGQDASAGAEARDSSDAQLVRELKGIRREVRGLHEAIGPSSPVVRAPTVRRMLYKLCLNTSNNTPLNFCSNP